MLLLGVEHGFELHWFAYWHLVPVKPWSHVQTKEPAVFEQTPFAPHISEYKDNITVRLTCIF